MTTHKKNPPHRSNLTTHSNELSWEKPYEIALALQNAHQAIDLEQVSLGMIYNWTLDLPEFNNEPELANEDILMSIYQEWFEEANSQ